MICSPLVELNLLKRENQPSVITEPSFLALQIVLDLRVIRWTIVT